MNRLYQFELNELGAIHASLLNAINSFNERTPMPIKFSFESALEKLTAVIETRLKELAEFDELTNQSLADFDLELDKLENTIKQETENK